MTREPAEPLRLDYLIRAGAIHSMTGEMFRSVGLRGPEIVAVSDDAGGLDDLAGNATVVVDAALLRERPISDTEVHLLLDGVLLIEIDQQPALEVGPGAIFDPATRSAYSKEHASVRARTPCRLAVLPRGQLDSQALLDSAAEQASRLDAYVRNRDRRS